MRRGHVLGDTILLVCSAGIAVMGIMWGYLNHPQAAAKPVVTTATPPPVQPLVTKPSNNYYFYSTPRGTKPKAVLIPL